MISFKNFLEESGRRTNKLIFFRTALKDVIKKIEGKTLIVFDTETTGLDVNLPWVQVTEVAAVAVDGSSGKIIDKFHKKINLTDRVKAQIDLERETGKATSYNVHVTKNGKKSIKKSGGYKTIDDLNKMTGYYDENTVFEDIKEVYQGFSDFINKFNNPVLVAQNAGFDMGQMFVPMKKLGIQRPKFKEVIDTMVLAKTYFVPLLKAASEAGDEEAKAMLEPLVKMNKYNKPSISTTLDTLGKSLGVKAEMWHSGISDSVQTLGILTKMLNFFKEADKKGLELSDTFKAWHAKMSNQTFFFGKNPSRETRAKDRKNLK